MDVKPLHVVLALLIFGSLLALASYSGMQAKTLQGPSDLQLDRNGDVHLRIGQALFVYDASGLFRDSYSLSDFNIDGLIGNFDFFADNSLLLVAEHGHGPLQGDAGRLLRCYRATGECTPLAASEFAFDRSFRVVVDHKDGIYLAATGNGKVHLLASDGASVARLPGTLERPNRVRLVDGQLAIADTQGRELLFVPLAPAGFAGPDRWWHMGVGDAAGHSLRNLQPLDFLTQHDDWWVLVKPETMRTGHIHRYDREGNYRSCIKLPAAVDPFAIAPLGDDILVADYAGLKVDRYSSAGELLGELTSPEQQQHLDDLRRQQALFATVQYASWGLFALALVAGFAIAIKAELQKSRDNKASSNIAADPVVPTSKPHHLDARVFWLQASKRPLWLLAIVSLLLLAMPLAITLGTPESAEAADQCADYAMSLIIWGLMAMLAAVFVPVLWKMRQVVNTRIGVADEWVLVDRGNGPVMIARDENLLRTHNAFIIDGVTIPCGTPQMPFYDKNTFEQWLGPRLDRAVVLGPGKHLAWQWQNQRAIFVVSAVLVLLGLAGVVAMEAGWFETWFEQWLQAQPACAEAAQATAAG